MGTVNSTFSLFSPSPLSLQTYFPSEYLSIFHPFSVWGTQPTSVLSFPVLHPCSTHSQPLAGSRYARYTICSFRSHLRPLDPACAWEGHSCPLAPGWVRYHKAWWVKKGGEGLCSSLPKASAPVWWLYLQLQFSPQVLVIITSPASSRPWSGNSSSTVAHSEGLDHPLLASLNSHPYKWFMKFCSISMGLSKTMYFLQGPWQEWGKRPLKYLEHTHIQICDICYNNIWI